MTFNAAPDQGPSLQDQIAALDAQIEEANAVYDSELAGKLEVQKKDLEAALNVPADRRESVADIVEEGDPVKLQELDQHFAVAPQEVLSNEPLHDAHVGAREAFVSQQDQEELRKYNERQEAIKREATQKVGDIFSARNSTDAFRFSPKGEKVVLNEDRKKIDMIKALKNLAAESRKDKGAAGWEPYRQALVEQIKKTGNESERLVLQELLDEDIFTVLARAPLTAEDQKRIERKDVEAGMSEEEAKEHAANIIANAKARSAQAESILAKMGVDTYNL